MSERRIRIGFNRRGGCAARLHQTNLAADDRQRGDARGLGAQHARPEVDERKAVRAQHFAIVLRPATLGTDGKRDWSDNRSERSIGARTEVTHTYRIVATDAALAARLATLKLDAAGRGFSFSPCARPERPR